VHSHTFHSLRAVSYPSYLYTSRTPRRGDSPTPENGSEDAVSLMDPTSASCRYSVGLPGRALVRVASPKVVTEADHQTASFKGERMRHVVAGLAVTMILFWSASAGQELRIGPAAGALFMDGSHRNLPGTRNEGLGASYSIGGEVVYSLATVPLDLVGQLFYSPAGRGYRRRENQLTTDLQFGRRGSESSLFSLGLGGRWVPLRGTVSPYVGASFLLSHQDGQRPRFDSTELLISPVQNPVPLGNAGRFGRGGGTTRFGAGLSVGSAFEISSLLDLDVGASYSFNTPFDRGGNLSTIGFGGSLLFRIF
jgi:hypothetical protein